VARLKMKAVVLTGHGGPEVLKVEERPDPEVGAGEVRIDVKASGLNFADTAARVGVYPDAPKPPSVLGYEVAGEVESVGDGVTDISVGDRVVAGTRFGGHASMVSVPTEQVLPLADRLSFEQGAAIPVNYSTAYCGLVIMGGVKKGERVLIHAAAGGVGTAAVQIARAHGAEVFGTASASKHDAIRKLGVQHPIDYTTQDFAEEVKKITGGEGIDIAFDALGPTSFRKDYRLLRPGGRLIMYGVSEVQEGTKRSMLKVLGSLRRMPFATMPWWKSLNILSENKGVFALNMLAWWDTEGDIERITGPLMEEFEAGGLDPVVAQAFPFEEAGEAHRFLGERKNIGKVVLTP
jgi:NADPH:quinone reductase-like Zn-dependent oxidoreductase